MMMIRHNNTTEKKLSGGKAKRKTSKNCFNYNQKKFFHEKAKNSSSKGKNQFKKLSFNAVHSL
jgi:hypothetical protein